MLQEAAPRLDITYEKDKQKSMCDGHVGPFEGTLQFVYDGENVIFITKRVLSFINRITVLEK